LAGILRNVFETDFDPRRPDSMAAREPGLVPLPPAPSIVPWPPEPPTPPRPARIVLAPDTTLDPEGILGLFASAKVRLSIDAFYLDEVWGDAPSPFIEAAFAAAHRGVSVRMLLDGSGAGGRRPAWMHGGSRTRSRSSHCMRWSPSHRPSPFEN